MKEIPGFQKFMLPLLKFASDKKEHSTNEALEYIADEFKLSDEQQNELLLVEIKKYFQIECFGQNLI